MPFATWTCLWLLLLGWSSSSAINVVVSRVFFIILQLAVYVFLCDFELTNALGILKRLIIMILSSLALSQFILEERFSSLPRFLRALRHVVLSNVQQQQQQQLQTLKTRRRRLRVFSYFHASSYFSLGGYAKKKPRNESKREENRMEEYKFQFTCPDTPLESSLSKKSLHVHNGSMLMLLLLFPPTLAPSPHKYWISFSIVFHSLLHSHLD